MELDWQYSIKTRKLFKISTSVLINKSKDELLSLIRSKGFLEYVHPYCKYHESKGLHKVGDFDRGYYYSGLAMERQVVEMINNEGYTLKVKLHNNKNEKNSLYTYVTWLIKDSENNRSRLIIQVKSLAYKNVPRPIWYLFAKSVLIPHYKKYFSSVILGVKYYSEIGKKVSRNQFGSQRKYSPKIQ